MFLISLWNWFLSKNDFMKIGLLSFVGVPLFIWLVFVAIEAVLHWIFWPLYITMGLSFAWIVIGLIVGKK